jgi:ribonuclease R
MQDKVGNIYDAVISSVTSFGLFVMLENTIEGLIHIKNMPDYYEYDEKKGTLSGNYTKVVYNNSVNL